MNQFEMVVMIVLIVTIGRVIMGRRTKSQRLQTLETESATDTRENARLQAEVARLNDRIKVLERLATDPAKRLSDEIEQLK
jgi:predicted  nucleic acid-binding Zn-ribbon protein